MESPSDTTDNQQVLHPAVHTLINDSTTTTRPQTPTSQSQSSTPSFYIHTATSPDDLNAIRNLFRAYTEWLDEDLTFQNYADELSNLPGKYASPHGCLLLARESDASGAVLGCIATRPLNLAPEYLTPEREGVRFCEVKRLFTYPAARGRGVAKVLIRCALDAARGAGYDEVLLDSLARMKPAINLYKAVGFEEVEPYYGNPLGGVVYMGKKLDP